MKEQELARYFTLLKILGADGAKLIAPSDVVTAPWPVLKCQYGCSEYGKSHCCPPKTPDYKKTREVLDAYSTGILFHRKAMGNLTESAVKCARQLFLDGYYKAFAFGGGPCRICPECHPGFCRFPEQAAPSMEACGIDVFATARNHGFEIGTLGDQDEAKNFFGLVLVE